MPVRITSRHLTLPDQVQDIVIRKSRKLRKYFELVDRIDVIFTAEKRRKICEINVHAGPISVTGKAENGEELPAFDKALKVCERQIKESKEKMIDRKQKALKPSRIVAAEVTTPV